MSFIRAIFGGNRGSNKPRSDSFLDNVLFTAHLASNMAAIDSILDTVRQVTSRLGPDKALSSNDEAALVAVYMELEVYLTTRDPVRRYTREELRSKLGARFRAALPSVAAGLEGARAQTASGDI